MQVMIGLQHKYTMIKHADELIIQTHTITTRADKLNERRNYMNTKNHFSSPTLNTNNLAHAA